MATPSIQASTLPQKSNNRFSYTPLPVGHIRLLRLCANADPAAQICCQLFNYPISRSTGGTHLYDAVSYVWGDHTKSHTIILAQEGPTADLRVTRNLWDVLRHLRDESLDRVIWVDAVCINQSDDMEKAVQIRRMTKIFSIASRVIVWLEEPGNGGDEALETLRVASEMKSLGRVVAAGEEVKERILRLLNTPWFQRIWVLQEVAAARQVIIRCGSTEIDGLAFCRGLKCLSELLPALQGHHAHAVAPLIEGANFRSKRATGATELFSLRIRPLGVLVEMYRAHQATVPHDRVYALLGMCSDTNLPNDLLPDYDQPWEGLLERLLNYLLGGQASVKAWKDTRTTVAHGKGHVLGSISEISVTGNGRTRIATLIPKSSGLMGITGRWTLPSWAHHVQVGDLICMLRGASTPIVIRRHSDFFLIVVVAPALIINNLHARKFERDSEHHLFLLWNWGWGATSQRDPVGGYEISWGPGPTSLQFESEEVGFLYSKLWRLWSMALILDDLEDNQGAHMILKVIQSSENDNSDANLDMLDTKERFALLCWRWRLMRMSSTLLEEVARTRKKRLGVRNLHVRHTVMQLAKILCSSEHNAGVWEPIVQLLEHEQQDSMPDAWAEEELIRIIESCRQDQAEFLLKWHPGRFPITKEILAAAARNVLDGDSIMRLLLAEYDLHYQGENLRLAARALPSSPSTRTSRTSRLYLIVLVWALVLTILTDLSSTALSGVLVPLASGVYNVQTAAHTHSHHLNLVSLIKPRMAEGLCKTEHRNGNLFLSQGSCRLLMTGQRYLNTLVTRSKKKTGIAASLQALMSVFMGPDTAACYIRGRLVQGGIECRIVYAWDTGYILGAIRKLQG